MSVISTLELEDEVATGRRTGDPQGAHRRLGPAVDEPDPFYRGHPPADQLGQANLAWAGYAERTAGFRRAPDRIDDGRIRVAENKRSECSHIVDVSAAGFVPDERALAPHQDWRLAADCAVSADRTVDPTWE